MMKRQKRVISALLAVLLCFTTGCSQNTENAQKETGAAAESQGSYQEENVELPFSEEEELIGMGKSPEEKIRLYTREKSSKKCYVYTMQEEQSFQKETFPEADGFIGEAGKPWTVTQGADGSVYFLYFDGAYIPHISRVKDGKAEELAAKELEKKQKGDAVDYPSSVLGAEDGSFVITYMGSQAQYFDAEGNLNYEMQVRSGDANIRADTALNGKNFLFPGSEKDELVVYDLEEEKEINRIALSEEADFLLLGPGRQEDFYMLDSQGMHHLTKDGKIVETCIDAEDMTALIEQFSPRFFEMDADGGCYVLYYSTRGDFSLKHYSRQEHTEKPEQASGKTLKIIGMRESNTMKRAVSDFKKQYPGTNIEFQSYEEVRKRGTLAETIRIMNTDLLSGENGADLVVLDGLPEDSYIEKGALEDLTAFAEELQGEDALFENLRSEEGEMLYSLPVRFSVPILYGTDKAMDVLDSLETILAFLEDPGDVPISDYVTWQFLAESLLVMNYDEITQDLSDASSIQNYMDAVSGLGNYVDADLQEVDKNDGESPEYLLYLGSASCLGRDKAALSEIRQISDLAEPYTFKNEYGQNIRLVDGLYIPYDSIGISSMSKNKEEAKDFLKILFSYAFQSIDMGEGFPVNARAFQEMDAGNPDREIGASWEEDGQEVDVVFANPDDADMESFKELVRGVKKPLHMDFNVRDLLLENVKHVYTGETDSRSAAADAAQKLKLYMAED
jgi:ABC-type glycerol-3-phosphate transport system substrate-binding protein